MNTLWRRRWALAPIALMLASVGFTTFTVRLALRDHGTAVERDYYRKAASWDERRAARDAGDTLRWTISPSLERTSSSELMVVLTASDKHGIPIDGAEVVLEGIPIRAADLEQTASLREIAPGRYAGTLRVPASGQWEFRVDLKRGEHRVLESFRRIVAPWPGAGTKERL